MYRFLIADDEVIIRQGIRHLLDYEALGFTVCAEASTGEQTYQLLMEHRPDAALVDIRMPGISGLEAVKKARKAGYQGKVIVVSSFSDFQYAQEAIRSGVDNYITKPIDEEELEQIFLELRQELDGAHTETPFSLEAVLRGTETMPDDTYQVLVWTPYSPESVTDVLRIGGISKEACLSCVLDGTQVNILRGEEAIRKFQASSFGPASRFLMPYFIGASAKVPADQLPMAFLQARKLLERRFFCAPSCHVLWASDRESAIHGTSKICPALLEDYTERFLSYILTFNRKLTDAALAELRTTLCSGTDAPAQVRLFLTDLYLQIKESMNKRYSSGTIAFLSNSSIIQQISQAKCLDDILDFLSERFDMIMSSTGNSTRDSVLDDVLHYIHHNYTDNITLEKIAPLFGYNHSYLGKIFRKKMGCSFNSYVDHVRIERAKELLLQDDAKVYAISEKVGYKNVDYFHVKFRKYVNQSPAEFRKANRKDI